MAGARLSEKLAAFKKKCESKKHEQRFYREWPESLVKMATDARRAWAAGEIPGMSANEVARFIVEEAAAFSKKNRSVKIPAVSTVARWVTLKETR